MWRYYIQLGVTIQGTLLATLEVDNSEKHQPKDIKMQYCPFSDKYFREGFAPTGLNMQAWILMGLLVFFIKYKQLAHHEKLKNNILINMLYASTVISFIPAFSNLPTAPVIRMGSYFFPVVAVLSVNAVYTIKDAYLKGLAVLCVFFLASTVCAMTVLLDGERYQLVPYSYRLLF